MKKGVELLKDLFDITGKVAIDHRATGGFGSVISMALAMAVQRSWPQDDDEISLNRL
jgi:hypothetical protein